MWDFFHGITKALPLFDLPSVKEARMGQCDNPVRLLRLCDMKKLLLEAYQEATRLYVSTFDAPPEPPDAAQAAAAPHEDATENNAYVTSAPPPAAAAAG